MRVRTALALLGVAALAGCGGSSTLSAKQLQKQAETVHSTAAEGALLAAGVADERTTTPFTKIHSKELADQAKSAASTLTEGKTPGRLEPLRRRLARRASEIESALEELHAAPDDSAVGRRVERELRRLSG